MRALLILLMLLHFGKSAASADERSIWVSPFFAAAPDVNLHQPPFAPEVVDLSELQWSRLEDGNVRLCFDNRPMHFVGVSGSENLKNEEFCRFDADRMSWKEKGLTLNPFEGLIIEEDPDTGQHTCKAIFTINSLLSALIHIKKTGSNEISYTELNPYGYSEIYFFPSMDINKFVVPGDKIEMAWGASGRTFFAEIALNQTWNCLLPAFRQYWRVALDTCLTETHVPSVKRRYYPLVKQEADAVFELAKACLRTPQGKRTER